MAECTSVAQVREEKTEEDVVERRTEDHLADLPDGAGCTGIWEYLSEQREADDD